MITFAIGFIAGFVVCLVYAWWEASQPYYETCPKCRHKFEGGME